MIWYLFSVPLIHDVIYTFWQVRTTSIILSQHIGSGGMADTRIVDTKEDEDPRKSISAAPSFEEYLKQREGANAAATSPPPAPAVASTPPQASSTGSAGGGVTDAASTISTLEQSQTKLVANIAANIPDLAVKPDASIDATSGFNINGNAVKLSASDAAGE